MYKKILLLLTIALMSFPAFSEENKNSIILGFGTSTSRIMVSTVDGSSGQSGPYGRIKDVEPKANISLAYLRELSILNNRLSVGFDLQTHFSHKLRQNQYALSGGNLESLHIKGDYTIPVVALYLIDYKLLKLTNFNISAQLGAGMDMQKIKTNVTYMVVDSTGQTLGQFHGEDTDKHWKFAYKAGLTTSYSVGEHAAIGLGVHYLNIGKSSFNLSTSDVDTKNKGILTTNLNLIYTF